MQISIPQSDLADIVSLARSVAKSGAGTDVGNILDHILIEADSSGRLTVTATDSLRMVIRRTIQCSVLVPGSVLVNASRMSEALGVFPKSVISVSVNPENNHTTMSCAGIVIVLRSLHAGDYPKTHFAADQDGIEVATEPLVKLIERMAYAPSPRPEHAGGAMGHASLKSDGKRVTLIGVRQMMVVRVVGDFAFPACDIMVPRQGIEEMVRVARAIGDKVSVALADDHLTIRGSGITLSVKVDSEMARIDVDRAMSDPPGPVAVFGREALLSGLKATRATMGSENSVNVTMGDNSMKLSSRNENHGSSVDLTVKAEYAGPALRFGAAVDPFIALLTSFTQDNFVSIGLVESTSSTGIATAAKFYLVAGSNFDKNAAEVALFVLAVPPT